MQAITDEEKKVERKKMEELFRILSRLTAGTLKPSELGTASIGIFIPMPLGGLYDTKIPKGITPVEELEHLGLSEERKKLEEALDRISDIERVLTTKGLIRLEEDKIRLQDEIVSRLKPLLERDYEGLFVAITYEGK
ncbi:MAG: hypothetical protein H3Z52_09305, partial [archaeon]|nr:hypothetical protein [archaeon]